jgi:23S rRNA pseudouridine1911/1915/1917 synthase
MRHLRHAPDEPVRESDPSMTNPPAMSVDVTVSDEQEGLRLDQALSALLPAVSRAQVQRMIRDGRVTAGGTPLGKVSEAVHAGLVLRVDLPPPATSDAAPEALPLDILYEDEDIIVVNKAPGMVVHPAAGHASGTLVNALLHYIDDLEGVGDETRPGIVHRLDKGTSGVMVVARNDAAHAELSRQFHDREIEKEYVTLVWGLVHYGRRIDAPVGRDPKDRQKMTTRARRARAAVTRVTWALALPGLSLLRVAIATGRTHQIRVHLSAIGHPVVGDATYGGAKRRVPPHLKAVSALTRPFLHAERLVLTHPRDGRRMTFEAPLADDLTRVLAQLDADIEKFGYTTT